MFEWSFGFSRPPDSRLAAFFYHMPILYLSTPSLRSVMLFEGVLNINICPGIILCVKAGSSALNGVHGVCVGVCIMLVERIEEGEQLNVFVWINIIEF